jgi:hypothetical protein
MKKLFAVRRRESKSREEEKLVFDLPPLGFFFFYFTPSRPESEETKKTLCFVY